MRSLRIGFLKLLTLTGLCTQASVLVNAAAVYYIAPNGNDNNTTAQAQNITTPWRTINHAAQIMVAGDKCYIRAGTYHEKATLKNGGTSSAPITFEAYNGESVLITGLEGVSSWQSLGNNLYKATVTGVELNNGSTQVFKSGAKLPEARWPNADRSAYPFPRQTSTDSFNDWARAAGAGYDSSNANGWITLPPDAPNINYAGARLHISPGKAWRIFHNAVKSYDAATRKIITDNTYGPTPGNAYGFRGPLNGHLGNAFYLTGKKEFLDQDGEWFYEPSTTSLYYYSTQGTPSNIEIQKRVFGLNLLSKSWINVKNINFFACTINADSTASHCTYDGLNMKYISHCEGNPSQMGLEMRNYFTLKNSEIAYTSDTAITIGAADINIINNNLHHLGYLGGNAINSGWNNPDNFRTRIFISHNTIHTVGKQCVALASASSIVEYNHFYHATMMCKDTGIYNQSNMDGENTILRYNIMHGSTGAVNEDGMNNMGIYLDNHNSNFIIHHNIVYDIPGNSALLFNRKRNFHMLFNNTLYGENGGIMGGYFRGPKAQDGETGIHVYNNLFNGNERMDWNDTDIRFNIPDDPSFVNQAAGDFHLNSNSKAIDKGVIIPGVTDGYTGKAPDVGAIEFGGDDWTKRVGYSSTPLSPEPKYSMPEMIFANKLKNAGFERNSIIDWTYSGAVSLLKGNAWYKDGDNAHVHSQTRAIKFNPGSSQISQKVTGLLPNRRYKFYAAIQNLNSGNTIKMGVRNFGRSTREIPASEIPLPQSPGEYGFIMHHVDFITGPTTTEAEVYVTASVPTGGTPAYLDSTALILSPDSASEFSPMPYLQYGFDEDGGTVVNDGTTGTGKDATFSGSPAPARVSGVQGRALSFNGTSAYVTTPSLASPTSELTVACWAKSPTTNWNNENYFVSQLPAFAFGPKRGTNKLSFYWNFSSTSTGDGVGATPPAGFDCSQWHHYAVTYSTKAMTTVIYIDGNNVASDVTNPGQVLTSSMIPILLGHYKTSYMNGALDDVRIYHEALSADEIKSLASMDRTLVLHLNFDDSSAATQAWDSSGYGRNGSLSGGASFTSGKLGGAINLDGTSAYVSTPAFPTPGTGITVSCYARSLNSTWNADDCLISKDPSFTLSTIAGTPNIEFNAKIGGVLKTVQFTAPAGFNPAAWHHYLGTYSTSSGALRIYVDGVLQNSVTGLGGSMDTTSSSVTVGRDPSGSNFLAGQVDDVKILGREFNASEVLEESIVTYGPYDSQTVNVTTVPNAAPKANAGADKTITLPTNSVGLSGSGTDTDGTIASYLWSQVSGPSTASFSSSTSASTTASGLVQGNYTFRLKVTDNKGASATDDVVVTVNAAANVAPTANAGTDKTITLPTNSVSLTGTGTDTDGTISNYNWSQISGPSTASISAASNASTMMGSLVQGSYTFRLKVTDNAGATATDDVVVTVNPAANVPPTVNAGSDRTLTMSTGTSSVMSVNLAGTATDSDGTVSSYGWSQVSGPTTATFTAPTSPSTSAGNLQIGTYIFRLTVTDNQGAKASDDISIRINNPPTANAGTDQTITLPTSSVLLAGSGTDSDGSIVSYAWFQTSGPSASSISSPNSANTTVGSLVAGTYIFRLTVKDDTGASAVDDVVVIVKPAMNVAPTANAGVDLSIMLPQNSVTLSGSGSDSDGLISSYSWTQLTGPSQSSIASPGSASTTAGSLLQGTYTFRLTVKDNAGATASDDVVVSVMQNQSVTSFTLVNADSDTDIQTINNGDTINLATLTTMNLNIRANTNPAVVGSVQLELSGAEAKLKTENAAPYALFTDNAGDYAAWVPVGGNYNLTATPYSGGSLTGFKGTPMAISFTVINQAAPVITSSLAVSAKASKAFNYQITASNNPSGFKLDGLVPAGLNFNSANGTIYGTPTVAGTYFLKIMASNVGGSDTQMLTLTVAKSKVLFVVGSTTLNVGDAAVKAHLDSMGYDVTPKTAIDATNADANGMDLVMISSTPNSKDTGVDFRDIAVPVLTWEGWLFDDMGMTGNVLGTDYYKQVGQTSVSIVNGTHPMAAGLSGVQTVYNSSGYLEYGLLNSSAITIATINGDATKPVLFGYEKGSQMIGLTAPARRVGFFLYDTEASFMTPQGWSLFDAAVKWSIE